MQGSCEPRGRRAGPVADRLDRRIGFGATRGLALAIAED
jgi:hypothetical protein